MALKNKKKNYINILVKSTGIIKKLINKNLYFLTNNKIVAKILIIFINRFYQIFSINIICIFVDTYNAKLSNYKNFINYINWYQIVFNKILNLITKDF